MKKLIFFVVALISMSWSQAYVDYTFNFTSNDNTFNVTGLLNTTINGAGPLTVTGGTAVIAGLDSKQQSWIQSPLSFRECS